MKKITNAVVGIIIITLISFYILVARTPMDFILIGVLVAVLFVLFIRYQDSSGIKKILDSLTNQKSSKNQKMSMENINTARKITKDRDDFEAKVMSRSEERN
jgi:FtsH-binding integral membrane protein